MDIDFPDQNQQREKIKNTQNPPPKVGDTYNLITQKWWNHWKSFVNYEKKEDPVEFLETSPPPIDNTDLLENGVLKSGLLENENYALVSSSSWDALKYWYGGGPAIPRQMIEVGESKTLQVEVYLLRLVVLIPDAPNPHHIIEMSRGKKVIQLIKTVAAIVYIPPHNCHLKVDTTGSGTEWRLLAGDVKDSCLQEVGIIDGTLLFASTDPKTDIAELQAHVSLLSSGKFLSEDNDSVEDEISEEEMEEVPSYNSKRPYSSIYPNNYTNNYSLRSRDGYNQNKEPGVTGLTNLGNTCFMNSALQCLSNTQPLTNYFIDGLYQKDINRGNPLGTGGKLADEYGKLMKKIWKGGFNSIPPSDFKWAVGRHAPQFEGYRQHDSQELLSYLLDGLHEDLNRVREKPYIPLKDNDNRPDPELAAEAWQAHLERNKSVIVDLFHGQLKSTVICPDPTCNHISITFDPFVYLSLPLPMSYDRFVDLVYVVPDPLKRPRRYRVAVDKRGTIYDLKCTLIKQLSQQQQQGPTSGGGGGEEWEQGKTTTTQQPQDLPSTPEELVVADVYRSNIYKIRLDKHPVEDINLNDITYVYLVGSLSVPPVRPFDGPESGGRRAEGGMSGGDSRELIRVNISVYHCIQEYMFPYEQLGIPKVISILVPKDRNVAISNLYEVFSYHIAGEMPNAARVDVAKFFSIGKPTPYNNGITKLPYKNDEIFIKDDEKFAILWKTKQDYEKRNLIMRNIENDVSMNNSAEEDGGSMSLDDCLKKFHEAEKLGKSDEWFCSRCRKFQQATKKFDLWKTPSILVIHLKRFQYTKSTRNKINTNVDFPLYQLDLTKYQLDEDKRANPPVYDLYAVSVHSGGLGGGHYTAYALNALQNKWYSFNDSMVSACLPNNVKTPGAYVLFYKRRDREDGVVSAAGMTTTTTIRDGVRTQDPMDFVKD